MLSDPARSSISRSKARACCPTVCPAIAAQHEVTDPLPFAWRGDCPPLTDNNAVDELCSIANEAAIELKRKFDVPVVMIWIDTLITAASFASGEDNDAAAAQKVMTALREISQRTGALVIGIDHFGKVMESGTRGSSAKEGAADTVIALLAERAVGGAVGNTRLAMRKQRDGMSGFEVPFAARTVEIGTDDDGDPITAPVIDWQAPQQTTPADARWTRSMQLLRRILMTMLADCGQRISTFLGRPGGTGLRHRAGARRILSTIPRRRHRTAKNRDTTQGLQPSRERRNSASVAGCREVDGVQFIWLATQEGVDG